MNKKVSSLLLMSITGLMALSGCGRRPVGPVTSSNEQGGDNTSAVDPGTTSEEGGITPVEAPSERAKKAAEFVTNTYKAKDYAEIKNLEWEDLNTYYKGLKAYSGSTVAANYAANTTLRIAAGYNNLNTGISFSDEKTIGEGLTLADGKKYIKDDLKPTWAHLEEKLKIDFEDKFTGAGSAEKEFGVWEQKLNEVDIVAGSSSKLAAAGSQGKLVDLNQHLDKMPNFRAYLESNKIARLSITGDTKTGAIYFSPYFDGVDDIERMPLVRADYVRELLDGTEPYKGDNRALEATVYTPFMPTAGKVEVPVSGKKSVTKDYNTAGNIVAKMNEVAGLTGDNAVAMLREYIDKAYAGKYGEKRSDLFLSADAAWDVDEMVALFRCAHASLHDKTENQNPLVPLFARESNNNQRLVDLFRFAGHLFGVRGLESRHDYMYFGKDGKLYDARMQPETYAAMEKMNALVKEGLITVTGTSKSDDFIANEAGLMSYDYNQTQTILNNTKMTKEGGEYVACMVPVSRWNDGTGEQFKRFTESWRSVKTDGWALSAEGIGTDTNKLNAALTLIDFAFSVQGQITMSYGPDSLIKVKDASVEVKTWEDVAKKYETFNFNGVEMPVIADATYAELNSLAKGNYTNYARQYLGSTLNGFPKSQAFEYQCTCEVGKKGAAILSGAIAEGTIEHPFLAINEANMWYTSVPTTLPQTADETTVLATFTDLNSYFSTSKGKTNILFDLIATGTTGREEFVY